MHIKCFIDKKDVQINMKFYIILLLWDEIWKNNTIYNLDPTVYTLWLVKDTCLMRVYDIEKGCFGVRHVESILWSKWRSSRHVLHRYKILWLFENPWERWKWQQLCAALETRDIMALQCINTHKTWYLWERIDTKTFLRESRAHLYLTAKNRL